VGLEILKKDCIAKIFEKPLMMQIHHDLSTFKKRGRNLKQAFVSQEHFARFPIDEDIFNPWKLRTDLSALKI
jgi:hypothetical protein